MATLGVLIPLRTPILIQALLTLVGFCNKILQLHLTNNIGVTRNYNFNIARGFIAPDGVNRSAIIINGAFPAPTIEANWGDTLSIKVCNNIVGPEEGTSLHWHGFLQKASPWYDGVPAIQQCPIAPGKCLTYSFVTDLYGSSWYHSHYSAQYNAGLLGGKSWHRCKTVLG